jgi:hypothetical protein
VSCAVNNFKFCICVFAFWATVVVYHIATWFRATVNIKAVYRLTLALIYIHSVLGNSSRC